MAYSSAIAKPEKPFKNLTLLFIEKNLVFLKMEFKEPYHLYM